MSPATQAALDRYLANPHKNELRLELRRQADGDVTQAQIAVNDAQTALARAKDALGEAKKFQSETRRMFDPARVAAASVDAARRCLAADIAERWSRGRVTRIEVECFLANIDAHRVACQFMRDEGDASATEPHLAVYFGPLLEAFGLKGLTPIHDPFMGQSYPPAKVGAMVDWIEKAADSDLRPGTAGNLLDVLARFTASGVRTPNEFHALERAAERERDLARPANTHGARIMGSDPWLP